MCVSLNTSAHIHTHRLISDSRDRWVGMPVGSALDPRMYCGHQQ